jgi:hypothetical protein
MVAASAAIAAVAAGLALVATRPDHRRPAPSFRSPPPARCAYDRELPRQHGIVSC